MKRKNQSQFNNYIELHPQVEELSNQERIAQAYIKSRILFNSIQ